MRFTDKERKSINTYSFRIDFSNYAVYIKNLDKAEIISFADLIERMKGVTFNLLGFCDKCSINAKIASLGYNIFEIYLKEYSPEFRWNLFYSNEEFKIIKTKDEVVIWLLEEYFGPGSNPIFKLPAETSLKEAKAILDKFAGFL